MRPASIIRFDQLFLGSIALGIGNTILNYNSTMAELEADPAVAELGMATPGFLIGASAFGFAISLLLWYFISRRASTVAKWIMVVLTVIGLVGIPLALVGAPLMQSIITLVITGMQIASLWFLFRPDAKAWFEHGPRGMDPSTFD
ncbi:hypothetical protein CHX26_06190 [Porphyrobacter sp. HT-58-2]|uniref:hypothetical protein n=1 Tax=Porphyrobacter sp. HT-58-2 TaxID=2023229 RepID=UPI000CDC6DCC|nr:hypothetical protein [Porphyrobacter sp. HT-58-2]AUX69142.1 hypothetical protein CHX26_06190 [Porphyrobacter sp. HT-58-2]